MVNLQMLYWLNLLAEWWGGLPLPPDRLSIIYTFHLHSSNYYALAISFCHQYSDLCCAFDPGQMVTHCKVEGMQNSRRIPRIQSNRGRRLILMHTYRKYKLPTLGIPKQRATLPKGTECRCGKTLSYIRGFIIDVSDAALTWKWLVK